MAKYTVDIRFCPCACCVEVDAGSAEDAEQKVLDGIRDGTLFSDGDKVEQFDAMLRNAETVEADA